MGSHWEVSSLVAASPPPAQTGERLAEGKGARREAAGRSRWRWCGQTRRPAPRRQAGRARVLRPHLAARVAAVCQRTGPVVDRHLHHAAVSGARLDLADVPDIDVERAILPRRNQPGGNVIPQRPGVAPGETAHDHVVSPSLRVFHPGGPSVVVLITVSGYQHIGTGRIVRISDTAVGSCLYLRGLEWVQRYQQVSGAIHHELEHTCGRSQRRGPDPRRSRGRQRQGQPNS